MFRDVFKSLLVIFATMLALPAFAALPAGYTELEYIESTGTQYINTGIIGTDVTGFEIKGTVAPNGALNAQLLGGTDYSFSSFFGAAYISSGAYWYGVNDSGELLMDPSHVSIITANIQSPTSQTGTLFDTETNQSRNFVKFVDVNWGFPQENLLLFGGQDGRKSPDAKSYYLKLYTQNGLVFHGIPARRDSDGVLGMYDIMDSNPSTAFHTNAGSGTFTAGPAKCRNLFDKNTMVLNTSVETEGQLLGQNNNQRTAVIPVEPNTTYSFNWNKVSRARVALYNTQPTYGSTGGTVVGTVDVTGDKSGTFTTAADTHWVAIWYASTNSNAATVDEFPGITDSFQLELGSTITDYVPFCVEGIKIATTAYNAAAFAPVEAALESAVTTIKDVVANTIVQADAIQNLQDTKQTMPDASGTNGTCPRFRQCLLIETANGTPQWFPIIDPFKDFVTPILANNDHITAVDSQARHAGDSELCQMLPQTDDEATNTGIAKCPGVANYKNDAASNTVKGGALKQTEWGYEFKAANIGATPATDNPNNDEGIVYGISKCVSTEIPTGTNAQPATSTHLNHALWNARPTTMAEAGDYKNCWCKMTSVVYDDKSYETSAAPWIFSYSALVAADCANHCAYSCANYFRYTASFRQSVMGWAVE